MRRNLIEVPVASINTTVWFRLAMSRVEVRFGAIQNFKTTPITDNRITILDYQAKPTLCRIKFRQAMVMSGA